MRLTDIFMELLAYVTYFNKSVAVKQPTYDQVKADITRLMSDIEIRIGQANIAPDDFDLARFAVVAWVDETLLSSQWKDKNHWQKEPLQRLYYQTADAGELFFDRLNGIGPHQRDVREVYYLCLAMGFKGRYIYEGDDFLLDQLKISNLKLLTGTSVGIPSLETGNFFPEAFPVETEAFASSKTGGRFSKLTLIGIAFPIVLFVGLFIIYTFILGHVGDSLLLE
jgi:type VI secretion system protein ImpK